MSVPVDTILSSIISLLLLQFAYYSCDAAKKYPEEIRRIKKRLAGLLPLAQRWSEADVARLLPSTQSLQNLCEVLERLSLTLQAASKTQKKGWWRRMQKFLGATNLYSALQKAEQDLNSAVHDFNLYQNVVNVDLNAEMKKAIEKGFDKLVEDWQAKPLRPVAQSTSSSSDTPKVSSKASEEDDLVIAFQQFSYKYSESDCLGSGTFGDVYPGTYKEEDVAVKCIRIHSIPVEMRKTVPVKLKQEADFLRSSGVHPNIIHVYGYHVGGNEYPPMLVMERMEMTLFRAIQDNKFDDNKATLIVLMEGVASALGFLHTRGIVHRDVKSQNLLVSTDPYPIAKLSDFGEAREKGLFSTAAASKSQRYSPNPLVGTLSYMAPEYLCNDIQDPSRKAEMYAFGVVLWECLTGQIPHDGKAERTIYNIAYDSRRTYLLEMPATCRTANEKLLRTLCEQCMDRDPKKRPTATRVVKHFKTAAFQEQIVATTTTPTVSPKQAVLDAKTQGIPTLLKVMEQHLEDASAQQEGCRALSSLALEANNIVTIREAGGIPVVVHAMQQHRNHAGVQEQGCLALRKLSYIEDNQVAIAKAGGIPVVVQAMQQHPNHAGVQEGGCGALRNLACNNENKVAIREAGGIAVLQHALQRFPTESWIQERGNYALQRLC